MVYTKVVSYVHKIKKRYTILVFGGGIVMTLHAQPNSFFVLSSGDEAISVTNAQNVCFGMDSLCFVDNSEYFNKIILGRTLLGYHLNPYFRFYSSTQLQVDLGLLMRHDLGASSFLSKIKPVFSVQYKSYFFSFLFGSLIWQDDHKLIIPLCDVTYRLLEGREQGLQFKYDSSKVLADLWIDWRSALEGANNKPEEFLAGGVFSYTITTNNKWNIGAPLQILLYHLGGQGITVKDYGLFCSAIGKKITVKINNGWLKSCAWETYYVLSKYIKEVERPFKNGFAFYTLLHFYTKSLSLVSSYWYGNGFASEHIGTPVYQSIRLMDKKVVHHEKIRSLLFFKVNYLFYLVEGVKCNLYLEPYYDFYNKLIEHTVGFSIGYSPCFKLATGNNVMHIAE